MSGGNAGVIRPRVYLLSGSPFGSIRKQENCNYITIDIVPATQQIISSVMLPHPINGARIEEQKNAYDNYIMDQKGSRLEEAIFTNSVTIPSETGGSRNTVTVSSEFDYVASARAKITSTEQRLKKLENSISGADSKSKGMFENEEIKVQKEKLKKELKDEKSKKDFFTWVCTNSFLKGVPISRPFKEQPRADSVPEWTYVVLERPGMNKLPGSDNRMLTPWQKKNPVSADPVHWGVSLNKGQPFNQPFEITYYYSFREPLSYEVSYENKYKFFEKDGKTEININLGGSLYFIIEIGAESQYHFILLFRYNEKPLLFKIGKGEKETSPVKIETTNAGTQSSDGKGDKAFLVDRYDDDQASLNMFKGKEMSVSIESANGCFYIRSSAFGNKPWIIHPNILNSNEGIFIGKNLSLYGGNMQAGFAYRPIQYYDTGSISLPSVPFEVSSEDVVPRLSVGNLGSSQVLQEQTQNPDGGTERLMVDTEELNIGGGNSGEDVKKYGIINTLLGKGAEQLAKANLKRSINIRAQKVESGSASSATTKKKDSLQGHKFSNPILDNGQKMNLDVSVTDVYGSPAGLISLRSGAVVASVWYPIVEMKSSNVLTDTGWTIPNGRSPYIWMVRIWIDSQEAKMPHIVNELTCDVSNIDLSWNCTGPGEINCTGNIKVLLEPRASMLGNNIKSSNKAEQQYDQVDDLMALTRRVSYIRIDLDRYCGVIPDRSGYKTIFTGCIVGADITEQPGNKVINFKLEDYMFALQQIKFVLSPYYDGMFYNFAVADIISQSGFPLTKMYCDGVNILKADTSKMPMLPCKNLYEEPKFRFKDGTSLKDAVTQISKLDWRISYFDNEGNFHFDELPMGMYGDKDSPSEMQFFTGNSAGWDPAKLVWNNVTKSYAIKDMYNSVELVTVAKEIPSIYLMFKDVNRESIENPNSDGYIGFNKVMRQKDGMFEGAGPAFAYFSRLTELLYRPPRTIKFETYGRTGFKPAMVVQVDGQKWRLMNINLRLDAQKNEFWASCEGEWFDRVEKGPLADKNQKAQIQQFKK